MDISKWNIQEEDKARVSADIEAYEDELRKELVEPKETLFLKKQGLVRIVKEDWPIIVDIPLIRDTSMPETVPLYVVIRRHADGRMIFESFLRSEGKKVTEFKEILSEELGGDGGSWYEEDVLYHGVSTWSRVEKSPVYGELISKGSSLWDCLFSFLTESFSRVSQWKEITLIDGYVMELQKMIEARECFGWDPRRSTTYELQTILRKDWCGCCEFFQSERIRKVSYAVNSCDDFSVNRMFLVKDYKDEHYLRVMPFNATKKAFQEGGCSLEVFEKGDEYLIKCLDIQGESWDETNGLGITLFNPWMGCHVKIGPSHALGENLDYSELEECLVEIARRCGIKESVALSVLFQKEPMDLV